MLDKMTKWIASFAMILEYKNPIRRVFFHFVATESLSLMNALAFVNIDQDIH